MKILLMSLSQYIKESNPIIRIITQINEVASLRIENININNNKLLSGK